MKPFEEDVTKLLETIKFRDTKKHFRNTLANDLKRIKSSDKMFVFADKTRNIYKVSFDTYNKLLHDNITKTYKHGSEDNISEINNELNHIVNKLSIVNWIECMKQLLFLLKITRNISKIAQNVDSSKDSYFLLKFGLAIMFTIPAFVTDALICVIFAPFSWAKASSYGWHNQHTADLLIKE